MEKNKHIASLTKQIDSAHKSFSAWPSWMREAAKFEDSSKKADNKSSGSEFQFKKNETV